MAVGMSFLKNGVRRTCSWPFPQMLCFITLENNIVYNLTMNQSVIIRYIKVIRTFTPIFPAFYSYCSTFLVITLVLELITSWFTADI